MQRARALRLHGLRDLDALHLVLSAAALRCW